jgi:hypothetical protein
MSLSGFLISYERGQMTAEGWRRRERRGRRRRRVRTSSTYSSCMKTREEKASLTLQGSVISSPVSSPSVESAVVVWVVASEHDALLVALLEGVKSL